ncbi:MAG: sigma-54-dependent Fis family transcriptional regulator [Bdellovibrionaceae bacterium]|nr:sigma-54-dependent Fis family transcriptional regulator [Pseudobdellovibrionaceae bacterium]
MHERNRILIIEDDIDSQELLVSFFKPRGCETIIYDDAQKALEALQAGLIRCDIILSDFVLPTISGIEFIKKIKSFGIETPIILITAQTKVEVAIEAIRAGAYDFVVKPIHFPQLLISVERALHAEHLKRENDVLKSVVQSGSASGTVQIGGVIGKSPGLKKVLDLAKRVATSATNVLITGESGTGKEIIAKAIHNLSERKKSAFVAINCSSIPENLLESELFGHTKGAFTGAIEKRIGLFEEAEEGTLFLDEIGDLSLPLQAKLLRVLQERKIKRIGENIFRDINLRIIAATHKDLRKSIVEKTFREDLFFRLNVIPIWIPPLRERTEDIIPLAEFFLKKFSALNNSKVNSFSKEALSSLLENPWVGNVRELENTIERAVVLSESLQIEVEDISAIEHVASKESNEFDFKGISQNRILTMDELSKLYVQYILKKNQGAKEQTARDLDIDRKTLYRRLHEIEQEAQSH